MTGWKKILIDHPDFQTDGEIQEETYQIHQKYKSLLQELWGTHFKHVLVYEARVSSGHGARWGHGGDEFIGFLEPFVEGA